MFTQIGTSTFNTVFNASFCNQTWGAPVGFVLLTGTAIIGLGIFQRLYRPVEAASRPMSNRIVEKQPDSKGSEANGLAERDIQIARRTLQIAEQAKPSPTRFIRTSIPQGIVSGLISWYQGTHTVISASVAKRAVDATSTGIVMLANAFFPAYSDAFKQGVALTISAPAVWVAADHLGYQQGYLFFVGVGLNVFGLVRTVYGHYQARKQREAQKAALVQANL